MGLAAEEFEQITLEFEGFNIEGLRYTLGSVSGIPREPLQLDQDVWILTRGTVDRVVFYGEPKTRLHILRPDKEGTRLAGSVEELKMLLGGLS